MSREWLERLLEAIIPPEDTILDLGVGPDSPAQNLPNRRTGVDVYQPHLDRAQNLAAKVLHDLRIMPLPFPPKSFGVVLMLDVLEHLEDRDAINLLKEAERIAEKQVIIYTPLGFVAQERDIYGLGGDFWMKHRCGFHPKCFRNRDYGVILTRGDGKNRGILAVLDNE